MALSIRSEADQVIFEEILGGRKVILNRPKKLNILNYEMLRKMYEKLMIYETDPTIKLVILKAYGKVFCAGGDLVSACNLISFGHWSFVASFYRKQFCVDYLLASYRKPLVAILNGIVMGGGVGISIHSTFRIVTENTIFAMPEASIGLFPDVGASYFLSRLPGHFGEYMGLTGARLDGAEMIALGLGTHFIPSQNLQSMEKALEKMVASSDATSVPTISMHIKKFTKEVNLKPGGVIARLDMINQCFSGESCEEILSFLINFIAETGRRTVIRKIINRTIYSAYAEPNGERLAIRVQEKWIQDAITSMKSASPIGLKIFLKTIREGRSLNIKQCLDTEYIALSHVLGRTISNDFYEGSRAMLIDKDKKPQWGPSKLEEVSDEMVAKCFIGSFSEDDDWLPLRLSPRTDEAEGIKSKL